MNLIIQSGRLDLIPLTPSVLRAVLEGNCREAGELLGIAGPEDWEIPLGAVELRLSELEADPGLQPWLLKAICLRGERRFVGHIGFHTAPGADYLADVSPGGVEFGFGVLEPWRRRGIAMEASEALMRWAQDIHQVNRFVLSISPDNSPSLGVAAKLGFQKIGSHIDECDGPEDIFERSDEHPIGSRAVTVRSRHGAAESAEMSPGTSVSSEASRERHEPAAIFREVGYSTFEGGLSVVRSESLRLQNPATSLRCRPLLWPQSISRPQP